MRTFSFDYNGHNSIEFDVMVGGISISEDIPLGLSRDILAGSINRYRSTVNHMGTQWSNVLQFELSFIKSPCEFPDDKDIVFTEYEVNEITAWLTSPDYPILLKMYDDDLESFTRYEYFGLFNDIQSQVWQGDIIGLTCTFTCNSPFAWTPEKNITWNSSNSDGNLKIVVNSAERNREIYPLIIVEPTSGNDTLDISITNITDNNKELLINVQSDSITYIDCQKYLIYNENDQTLSLEDLGISDVGYFYMPRLYNGENEFEINGDANITFVWREPRKVGAY